MWLLPSMSRLSLGPRRDVVATGMPPAEVPGRGKKQKTGNVKTYYEKQFDWLYQNLDEEVRSELFAKIAEELAEYGFDPNGDWVWNPLPDALLRAVFGEAAWNTTPIDRHWKWKYDLLFKAHTALVLKRTLKQKGANARDEESAPGRKRAKRLASQARWKQSFDMDQIPRGTVQKVDDARVLEDLKRQFPEEQDFPDKNDAYGGGRTPACCMHNR